MSKHLDRRTFLKGSVAASTGITLGQSHEEEILLTHLAKAGEEPSPNKPVPATAADMPTGKIGELKISRLMCGGNLIGGWAHSRDLMYVSDLFKAYNTDEKIFDTMQLCEENGVNTIVTDPVSTDVINRYWRERGGDMQWIVQGRAEENDLHTGIRKALDSGADAAYLLGNIADGWVKKGRIDLIAKVVEFTKQMGVPAGVGGHSLDVVVACEKEGINPDFYVKTLHSSDYWSAKRPEQDRDVIYNLADNYWSITPEETIEFMKTVKQPWIAFKTLAAGAIHPKKGLKYAFENGADFACVGMFDFQVAEDAAIAKEILANVDRKRPWRA